MTLNRQAAIAAVGGLVLTGGCSTPASPPDQRPVPSPIHAHFACKDNRSIDALFTTASPGRVDLTLSDGRVLSLPQALSASGARYATSDERIVFWNKGDTAFIEENGKPTYTGCVARR